MNFFKEKKKIYGRRFFKKPILKNTVIQRIQIDEKQSSFHQKVITQKYIPYISIVMKLFHILLWSSGIISALFLFAGISVYGVFLLWSLFCKPKPQATWVEPEVTCELVTVNVSDSDEESISTDSQTDAETDYDSVEAIETDETTFDSMESY